MRTHVCGCAYKDYQGNVLPFACMHSQRPALDTASPCAGRIRILETL
jgi:hypothetical protein